MFIVYCLLFIVYCLLFIVYCLLFIVYCLLFIMYYLLFIVYCLLFIVYCLLFICLLFISLLFIIYFFIIYLFIIFINVYFIRKIIFYINKLLYLFSYFILNEQTRRFSIPSQKAHHVAKSHPAQTSKSLNNQRAHIMTAVINLFNANNQLDQELMF